MKLQALLNWKIILIYIVIIIILNSGLIFLHNSYAKSLGVQCISESPECNDYCERGINSIIDDTKGKTGQTFKASEICCCSVQKIYPYYRLYIMPMHLIIIYAIIALISLGISKIRKTIQ